MPTYEYLCQSCGARFEAWQKITDDPIEVCPTCGEHVRRIIFPVGLVFKGSGFYINDTRSGSSRATPAAESGSGKGADTSGAEASASAEAKDGSSSGSTTGSSGAGDAAGSAPKESPKSGHAATASGTSGSSSGN